MGFCLLLSACNDGDIIDVELDFNKTLSRCELSTTEYFLYDTKKNPSESLSLIFQKNSTTDLIFNPPENNYESTLVINGTSTKFNYRTYDGNPDQVICSLLPDAETQILKDYAVNSGTVTTTTTYEDEVDPETNKKTRTYTIKFYIHNVNLEIISLTEIDFGTYSYTITTEN